MRISLILTALAAVFISSAARAETLRPGSPACITQDLLEQLDDAVRAKDNAAMMWLFDNGCTISSSGLHVTVLDLSTWGGMARIRAYRGRNAVEVWTHRIAVEGYSPLNP